MNHLSPSQLSLLQRCPEAYRRSYIEKEKIPPRVAMLRGRGVHEGAQVNWKQKKETYEDLPKSDIIDASVAAFEAELADGYELSPKEVAIGAEKVIGEEKDRVAAFGGLFADKIAPDYQPIIVEQPFSIELGDDLPTLDGVVDLYTDERVNVDFKTALKSKNVSEAAHSIQLTSYAAGIKAITGQFPVETRLDVLVSTKDPKRQIISRCTTHEDFAALKNTIVAALSLIDAGVFMPASPSLAWWCSPNWCGYWSTCPYVNGSAQAVVIDMASSVKPKKNPTLKAKKGS